MATFTVMFKSRRFWFHFFRGLNLNFMHWTFRARKEVGFRLDMPARMVSVLTKCPERQLEGEPFSERLLNF